MGKMFTLAETREMNKFKIETELGKCSKKIEELGMDHVEVCELISTIMNLGIAAHEKVHDKKTN